MKTIGSTIIMLALASSRFADNGKDLKLASPDGPHEIVFYQKQVKPAFGKLLFHVLRQEMPASVPCDCPQKGKKRALR